MTKLKGGDTPKKKIKGQKPNDAEALKKKVEKRKLRESRTKQKADIYFAMYYKLGPERSLLKLRESLSMLGLKRALNTFKNYSHKYDWQKRVTELDVKLKEKHESERIFQIEHMNRQQAVLGKNMRNLSSVGLQVLIDLFKKTDYIDLPVSDIVALAREGTKIERLAMGEATDRIEQYSFIYNVMALGIIDIFRDSLATARVPKPMRDSLTRVFFKGVDAYRREKMLQIETKKD